MIGAFWFYPQRNAEGFEEVKKQNIALIKRHFRSRTSVNLAQLRVGTVKAINREFTCVCSDVQCGPSITEVLPFGDLEAKKVDYSRTSHWNGDL